METKKEAEAHQVEVQKEVEEQNPKMWVQIKRRGVDRGADREEMTQGGGER